MKAIQHALPHNTKYTLVRTFHTGGIENGVGCQNCGKVLSNVAVVANTEGQQFQVGMDCAATLSTVNPFEFDAAVDAFATGKKVRTALLKWTKEYKDQFGVAVFEIAEAGTEVAVRGHRMKVTGGASHRDGLFTYYVSKEVYLTVVKPLCGELLPATVQTLAERVADQDRWSAEFKAAFNLDNVAVAA